MSTKSFSIWVMPKKSDPVTGGLQAAIGDLSRRFGCPVFEPHVTLLGGIEGTLENVLEKSKQLAATLRPYELRLHEVGIGSTFHQYIYFLCEPTLQTMDAGAQARALFIDDATYMPHLSMMYATRETVPDVEAVAQEVRRRFFEKNEKNVLSFEADALYVWKTPPEDRTLRNWECIASFPFS